MKHKEEKAFERADQFKVGDKINLYFGSHVTESTISRIVGDYFGLIGCSVEYHFKACRKLTEIKPREWWIRLPCDLERAGGVENRPAHRHVHVREVIDEE